MVQSDVENISELVPATRRGYIGPKWRVVRPLKNLRVTPARFSHPYDTTNAYILNDDLEALRADMTPAQRLHYAKCRKMRNIFNNTIDTDKVESITYSTSPNSTARFTTQEEVEEYFVEELENMSDTDLMCIYFHVGGRGNGDQYEWMNIGTPGKIDAYSLFQRIIELGKHVLIILDGPVPTRFGRSLKCPYSAFEIIHTSGPALNSAGHPYTYDLTEAIDRALPQITAEPEKLKHRKSIPQILARERSLWNNPQRQWTNKTKFNSTESVVRFCVEPADVALLGKIRIHGCEIQGDWSPVHGARPGDDEDDNDDHDSGNEGGDDDSDDETRPPPPKRQRGRKIQSKAIPKKSMASKTSKTKPVKAMAKTSKTRKTTTFKTTTTTKSTGRSRGGRKKNTSRSSATVANDMPLLNLRDSSVPLETDDEALITPQEEEEPYSFFKREASSIMLSNDDEMKQESDIEIVSSNVREPAPRGGNMMFVSDSEDDGAVEFVSMHHQTIDIDSDGD
ncbi:hypothetical protein LTR95_005928 [Oleoguttula sp. CCFEE 5521]